MTASPVMIPFVRLLNGEGVSPPFRATAGAAGYDLHAAEDATIEPGAFLAVATAPWTTMASGGNWYMPNTLRLTLPSCSCHSVSTPVTEPTCNWHSEKAPALEKGSSGNPCKKKGGGVGRRE